MSYASTISFRLPAMSRSFCSLWRSAASASSIRFRCRRIRIALNPVNARKAATEAKFVDKLYQPHGGTRMIRAGEQKLRLGVRIEGNGPALDYDLEAGSAAIARGGPVPSSQAIYRKIIDLIEHNQSVGLRHRSARERVVDAFEDHVFTQRAVAKRLGLSVATLRRRLEIEGSPSVDLYRGKAPPGRF